MLTVGDGTKLVIDFENYRIVEDFVSKDEGEQNVANTIPSVANIISHEDSKWANSWINNVNYTINS